MHNIALFFPCCDNQCWEPGTNYLKRRYHRVFVLGRPAVNKILAERRDVIRVQAIRADIEDIINLDRFDITVVIGGHCPCARNPGDQEEQEGHLRQAAETIKSFGLGVKIGLLLMTEDGNAQEVPLERFVPAST